MDILYIDWNMYGKDDIIAALKALGHNVAFTDVPVKYEGNKELLEENLVAVMTKNKFDAAFTSNYYPVVSNICQVIGIKYISWTYDSPLVALYDKSISNSCNYTFTFDSSECNALNAKGVDNVFYMPLAVNPKRLNQINITDDDKKNFSADVSLVASLYNEEHNLYERMEAKLDEYAKGYLDAILNVQKNLFGAFIMEEAISNEKIMSDMYKALPYNVAPTSFTNREYVYANYILSRKVAFFQRMEFIKAISEKFDMKVYTGGDISDIRTARHMGTVDYMTDMNKVFKLSKINLNITLPSIHTGIPLRAMDIMGNGGFLLTNYQQDFLEFFEPGVDFVYYTCLDEAIELISYYLEHDDERRKIAENAGKKMAEGFSFEDRLNDMLYIVENG